MPQMLDEQRIVSGLEPIASPTAPNQAAPPGRAVRVAFVLDILDSTTGDAVSDTPVLKAGERYRVQVLTDDSGGNSRGEEIASNIEVLLGCDPPDARANLDLPGQRHTVSPESARTFVCEFDLKVKPESPTRVISLDLHFKRADRNTRFRPGLAQLPVKLEASPQRAAVELLPVSVTDTPQFRGAAFLHVNKSAEGKIELYGVYDKDPKLNTQLDAPAIGLAYLWKKHNLTEPPWEHFKDKVFLQTIYAKLGFIISDVNDFSRTTGEKLLAWIKDLVDQHGPGPPALTLIVVDNTEYEIPWEMVYLKYGEWLGAVVQVVRWIPAGGSRRPPVAVEPERAGSLLAYVSNPAGAGQAGHSTPQQFARSPCNSVRELLGKIQALPPPPVGMIYLYCHGVAGVAGPDDGRFTGYLRSLTEAADQVYFREFNNLRPWPEGARPLVFVNACHSARMTPEFKGLPEVLLDQVAAAYIGTLGPVWSEDAIDVAKALFEHALNNNGKVPPAEVLQRFRADAAKTVVAEPTLENWRKFLSAFMYVYYGNALAQFRLE